MFPAIATLLLQLVWRSSCPYPQPVEVPEDPGRTLYLARAAQATCGDHGVWSLRVSVSGEVTARDGLTMVSGCGELPRARTVGVM